VFEALGDERRACAHFRAAAELDPKSDDALYEALRCRARILEGKSAVLGEARALDKMGPRVKKLVAALEAGEAPRYSPSGGYLFKASVTCAAPPASAPKVIVITAAGVVVSPWTPDKAPSEASSVAIQSAPDGTYRTIAFGAGAGAQCELSVQASGISKKFPVPAGEGERLTVRTSVETFGHWEPFQSKLCKPNDPWCSVF
jgi:Ca-activated chloride channel family protein